MGLEVGVVEVVERVVVGVLAERIPNLQRAPLRPNHFLHVCNNVVSYMKTNGLRHCPQ